MAYRSKKNSSLPDFFVPLLVVVALFVIWGTLSRKAPEKRLAITDVRILDGVLGKVGKPSTILISGGNIWRVVPADYKVPSTYTLISARGATAIPGMIDLGTFVSLEGHLPADSRIARPEPNLAMHLRAGVTTVLDLNSSRTLQRDYRQKENLLDLPAILFAGPVYTGVDGWRPPGRTPWENNLVELSSPEEIDSAWRSHVTFGYDLCFVSLEHPGIGHPSLDAETLSALARRARQRKLPLIIHATTQAKIEMALDVKPNLIVGSPRKDMMTEETIQKMINAETSWAPALGEVLNLWPMRQMAKDLDSFNGAGHLNPLSRNSLLRPRERKQWVHAHSLDATDADMMLTNVRNAYMKGVRIVTASLAGVPGVTHGRGLHREMKWMMRAGLSAREVLAGATGRAALAIGLKDRGRIRSGMRADIVLLDGNPTENPDAHLQIKAVILNGKYMPVEKMDE